MSRRPAEGPDRQPAADDLAEGREVGADALAFLDPAGCDAEAGHDLIEDQHAAVARGQLAQAGEKSRPRQHEAHVADVRLDDDRRDLVAVRGERGARPRRGRCTSTTIVSRATPSVMPGESGTPLVSAPLPAEIRNASPWPW